MYLCYTVINIKGNNNIYNDKLNNGNYERLKFKIYML